MPNSLIYLCYIEIYLPTICPFMPYLNLLGRLLHNVADATPLELAISSTAPDDDIPLSISSIILAISIAISIFSVPPIFYIHLKTFRFLCLFYRFYGIELSRRNLLE